MKPINPSHPWDEEDEEVFEGPPPPAPPPAPAYSVSLSAKAVKKMNEQTIQAKPAAKIKGTVPLPHVKFGKSGNTGQLEAEDIDEDTIIGPSKGFVNQVYATSARMNPQHLAIAESAARDGLALQSASKRDVLTTTFTREGVTWNAGYSSDLLQTPLGHGLEPDPLPEPGEAIQRETIHRRLNLVVYTVNPHLQMVLEPLLPVSFRNAMIQARGHRSNLRQICIYFLPLSQGTSAGFMHEFVSPRDTSKRFYFYAHTSVGTAPVEILEDILQSLEAGLPDGESAEDYTVEPTGQRRVLRQIGEDVEHSLQKVSESMHDSVPFKVVGESIQKVRDLGPTVTHSLDQVDNAIGKAWRKTKRWFGLR